MTKRPPADPKPITAARLDRIRRTDPELVELLDRYVDLRLQHIVRERAQLLKLRRMLTPIEQIESP